jgi:hypothetical protein
LARRASGFLPAKRGLLDEFWGAIEANNGIFYLNLSGLYVKMGKIEKIGKLNKPVLIRNSG